MYSEGSHYHFILCHMNTVLFFFFKGIHILDAVWTNVTKFWQDTLKVLVEPHPVLKHSRFWWYFRTLVGQFEALLQILRLIWEDEAAPSPTAQWYFAIWCYYMYIVGVVFVCPLLLWVKIATSFPHNHCYWMMHLFAVQKFKKNVPKICFSRCDICVCVPNQKFVVYFLFFYLIVKHSLI